MNMVLSTAFILLVCIVATACAGHNVDTKVVNINKRHVAYTEFVGDYDENPREAERLLITLFDWADSRELLNSQNNNQLIMVVPDELNETPENKRRLQMAITVPQGTQPSGVVKMMIIPGGKYGVGRFSVSDDDIDSAWEHMLGKWLPKSGHSLDDRPPFQILLNDPESHPQGKNVIDIYIPVS